LLDDAAGQDSLPLLAFVLERLYREFGAVGHLTLDEYRNLGGIAGAIQVAAQNAFAQARARGLRRTDNKLEVLLRKVFLPYLVRVDEHGEFVRRLARLDEIPRVARSFVNLLANEGQRLLVTDGDTVEVSHEVILREWPLLHTWLIGEREHLVWRQRVE